MTGIVISNKLATLYELQTVYSYEDMLDMVEVLEVNRTNEEIANQEVNKDGR